MKKVKILVCALLLSSMFLSCKEDDVEPKEDVTVETNTVDEEATPEEDTEEETSSDEVVKDEEEAEGEGAVVVKGDPSGESAGEVVSGESAGEVVSGEATGVSEGAVLLN